MANVFELTDVARKLEVAQLLERGIGDAFGLDAQLLCTALQKVARQNRDIFAPLSQCG